MVSFEYRDGSVHGTGPGLCSVVPEKLSAAIANAHFTASGLAALFELEVLDDRAVGILPMADAINSHAIAKSYTGTITVKLCHTRRNRVTAIGKSESS